MAIYPSSMPYDDVSIIDQSQYVEETATEEVNTIPSGPIALCPFVSPRGFGEDNKLMYMTRNRLDKYGMPNLKKYGLSLYLAKRFIEGGGTVLGMRVMPDDAKFSGVIVNAKLDIAGPVIAGISEENPTYSGYKIDYSFSSEENKGNYEISHSTKLTFDSAYMLSIIDVDASNLFTGQAAGNETFFIEEYDSTATYDKTYCLLLPKSLPKSLIIDGPHVIRLHMDETINFRGIEISDGDLIYVENEGSGNNDYMCVTMKLDTNKSNTLSYSLKAAEADIISEIESAPEFSVTGSSSGEVPIFAIKAKAKGKFADAFKFRITADDTMNAKYGVNDFCYKFIDSDNGNTLDKTMSFSFNDDLSYSGSSMAIEDVFDEYSENIEIIKSPNFDSFIDTINELFCNEEITLINPNAKKSAYEMDLLFGSNTSANGLIVDITTTDLSKLEGTNLSGGSDGSFGIDKFGKQVSFDWDNDPFATELAKVYTGEKTDLIYDEVRYPFTYIFAPSYNHNVVEAIHELVSSNRRITRANYFVKKCDTYTEAREAKASLLDVINNWRETIVVEWAQIKDPYTNRRTFMPSVYFDAMNMPNHWITKAGKPYAGRNNYSWTGFTINSVTPASTNADEYIANHSAGINTMCEDGRGYAVPYEQITAQQGTGITSSLSEINNSITLCEMVRIALRIASDRKWTDLGDEEVTAYRKIVADAIALELTGCYKNIDVIAERESVNGAGRNRIHCKINVSFKDILKGVSYEFYILAN